MGLHLTTLQLALKPLKNFKINTGETDSREYLINGNVKETDEGVKVAVKNIILYDELYKDFSLLDIAIEKVFGWKIGWVDQTIRETTVIETKVNDDGTVTTTSQMVDSKRSFDIDSKNVYAFLTQDVSKKFECIFDFNIMTRTINVYSVKDYGKDSNVFISYRNLIQTLPKLLMGLDGNNEPYLYFYSVAPYTSVSISGGIIRGTLNGNVTGDVSGNVNGYIINSESTSYRPAICTSTDDGGKYYVSIIRTNVDNKITIRGKWDYQKFETRTFQLTTSDRRLKRNIKNTNIDNALSQILKINHREFIWKESNNYIDLGYIAQELEDINPNMVIKPSESNEPYGVNTFYMESLITKSIQEMYAELKAENKQLKQRIEYLEQQIN